MSTAVASIAENTGGGLYAYRCSKAGLNMSMKVSSQSDNFSLLCEQSHFSEPFCGPGGLGAARDGDAPRMGSHRDGGAKCTGLADLKILLNCEWNYEMYHSCIFFQITTETCCSTMIQTLEGLTEKVQLILIVTRAPTSTYIIPLYIYHGRKICIMRIRVGLLQASAPISINVEPDVSEPCWGGIYIITDAAYI